MSDTGREKSATWRYVYMTLTPRLAVAGVELIVLDHAKWSTVDLFGGADKKTVLMPMFTNRDGTVGQTHKYCSNEWKSRPVDRYIRSLGLERGERWIGYSIDEYHRCRARDETAAWNPETWRTILGWPTVGEVKAAQARGDRVEQIEVNALTVKADP
jgi:hypothetical protein